MTKDQIFRELVNLYQLVKVDDFKTATRLLQLMGLAVGLFHKNTKQRPIRDLTDEELDSLLIGYDDGKTSKSN